MAAQVEPPSAPTGRKTARGKGAKIGQAQAPAAPAQQLDLVEALAVLKNGSPPPAAK